MVKLMKNEKREVKKNKFWYVFGSVTVTVGAMLVLPKLLKREQNFFMKAGKLETV